MFAPLDQNHCVAIENLTQAQRGDFFRTIQTVQINVINAAVFVDQREGRAGYFFRLSRAQAADDSFGEGRFPTPKLPISRTAARRGSCFAIWRPSSMVSSAECVQTHSRMALGR